MWELKRPQETATAISPWIDWTTKNNKQISLPWWETWITRFFTTHYVIERCAEKIRSYFIFFCKKRNSSWVVLSLPQNYLLSEPIFFDPFFRRQLVKKQWTDSLIMSTKWKEIQNWKLAAQLSSCQATPNLSGPVCHPGAHPRTTL